MAVSVAGCGSTGNGFLQSAEAVPQAGAGAGFWRKDSHRQSYRSRIFDMKLLSSFLLLPRP